MSQTKSYHELLPFITSANLHPSALKFCNNTASEDISHPSNGFCW